MKEKFLIIDGNNLLYASYYAAQKLPWKIPQGAIFFFLRVMISLLKKNTYQKLLITFDGGGINWRQHLQSQYKSQREKMPADLWEQMENLKKLLRETNITYLQLLDQEADDLIASFIKKNQKIYPEATFDILTRDKDLLQLLSERVSIWKYIAKKLTLYTLQDFYQEYNFLPTNYPDYLSLLGDNVDNVPGVKGIGPVNAKKLIQQFQSVENIYQKPEKLPENIRELVKNSKELVYQNKKVISLDKNIDLILKNQECDFSWDKWKKNSKLQEFCQNNRFNSILKLLD